MIEIYYCDNGIKKGSIEDIDRLLAHRLWIDITGMTKKENDIIKDKFCLHDLTAEDLLKMGTRVKVEEFSSYIFCVFYGIEKRKAIEMIEIDFILSDNYIISSHKRPISTFTEFIKNEEKIEEHLKKGCDFIFHKLLDMEVDNYAPVLETIDDDIEKIEEKATTRPHPSLLAEILNKKRHIIQIKKIVLPQREKISFLAKNNYRFISKRSIPYFRDLYDNAIRVSDTIDNYREATSNAFDAYMSAVSNNMNEVMKTLSIIATVALPLTVISGIYGTNFDMLPGQHSPYGFWIMIILMLLFIGLIAYYFWKRGWYSY